MTLLTENMSTVSFPPLQVKRLSPKGRLPTRGSKYAAGYDLYR